jgi:lysophospholipase L1-like esterase
MPLVIQPESKEMKKALFVILLLISGTLQLSAQSNLDFEQGLEGWQMKGGAGNFSVENVGAYHGKFRVRIGTGQGILQTHVSVGPLSIIQYNGYIKSSEKGVEGKTFISFYNANHQLILTYKSGPIDTTTWQETGNYTETPAETSYAEIGVEKEGSGGYIYADDFSIETNIGVPKVNHAPLCNLDQYMHPFWKSDTIYNETVLMFSVNGNPAEGKLLFMPDKILSVKNFAGNASYEPSADYTLNGNMLTRTPNSHMPFRADTSFDTKKDLDWFNTQSQWVAVTYTHHDKWDGPAPIYKGGALPRTSAKLQAKQPLKIVAFGMSITRGMDVSSYDMVPPYMPTYVDLFARQLRKAYKYKGIRLINAGLPGSVVDWGAQYADKYVNPLKPDLVILDFGMNDFWRMAPDQFKGYMQTIIRKIKAANPKVEFILLSNMAFDPDYVLDSDKYKSYYKDNLEGYSKVLKVMEGTGMVNLDMYSISQAIYNKKKAKDCLVNPLHPNDYMARWYAQGLAQLLIDHL